MIDTKKKKDVKNRYLTSIFTQLDVQFVKTRKQTNYQSNNKGVSTYNTSETPLNVGVGLHVYHSTRCNKIVKFLSDLSGRVSYDKIIDIKKDIAANIMEKNKEHDGVLCLRHWLTMSQRFLRMIIQIDKNR